MPVYRIWTRIGKESDHTYKTADDPEQAVRKLPPRKRPFVVKVQEAGSAAYRGYDDAA